MSTNAKNVLTFVVGAFVLWIVLKVVLHVVFSLIFGILLPAAVVCGIVYLLYEVFGRKALGGGRRTLP